ncbi:MAG: M48 family metallopeptidase [Anaerorhabdus sp.]
MKIQLSTREVEVIVERKKIKNMYLRLNGDALYITANNSVPLENIESFILSKEAWVEKVYEDQKNRKRTISKGVGGPQLYLFGEKKFIRYELAKKNYVEMNEDIITFYLKEINDDLILSTFEQFAKPLLMKVLEIQRERWDRVIQDYHLHQLPTLKIRTMTSQWGNCMTNKAIITMNLSLVHYPVECIDSVLWHEYVHLLVPNHSKRFYEIIEYHMPEYKKYKNMLK